VVNVLRTNSVLIARAVFDIKQQITLKSSVTVIRSRAREENAYTNVS